MHLFHKHFSNMHLYTAQKYSELMFIKNKNILRHYMITLHYISKYIILYCIFFISYAYYYIVLIIIKYLNKLNHTPMCTNFTIFISSQIISIENIETK